MIWEFIFYVCLGIGVIGVLLYFIWLYEPEAFVKNQMPSTITLYTGETVDVTAYPKFYYHGGAMRSKGIMCGDILICDPEYMPKLYVHDIVSDEMGHLYIIDTCHKDGTYTLKNDVDTLHRVERDRIKQVVKYVLDENYNVVIKF